tara:strand:+ start:128 stop:682 length:555 start_codon:yes stop_codon:yes gene_type:complete
MERLKDMLRKCYEKSLFLSKEEMKRHIDQSPNWGHVPIPGRPFRQDLSPEELKRHIDQSPRWKHVPIPEDLLNPEKKIQDGGYIPKMPAFPPFLHPGEVPGQQIALDEWLRRHRVQQDMEDKQRELKEVVEAIRGGPFSQLWWWLTHRNPLDKPVHGQMEKHPELEAAGKKVLEGLPGRGGLPD